MINLVNHITQYTADSAIAATVGYGLTRAFTVLNPVAGATFVGSVALAGALTDPIFNRTNYPTKPYVASNQASITLGRMIQVALAWAATPYLTPIVSSTLSAISAEVLSTGALVAGSISVTPQVAGITALALVIILGYKFGGKAARVCKNLGKALKAKLSSSSSFPKNLDPRIIGSTRATGNFGEELQGFNSGLGDRLTDSPVRRGQREDVKGKGCLVQ